MVTVDVLSLVIWSLSCLFLDCKGFLFLAAILATTRLEKFAMLSLGLRSFEHLMGSDQVVLGFGVPLFKLVAALMDRFSDVNLHVDRFHIFTIFFGSG